MKKIRAVLVLLAVISVLILIISVLPSVLPKEEILDTNLKNTEIYYDLLNLGMEDVVVDVTEDRIVIRYNDVGTVQMADIARIAANAAPDSERIIVQKFRDFEPSEQVEIKMTDAIDLANEAITMEEFSSRVKITPMAK